VICKEVDNSKLNGGSVAFYFEMQNNAFQAIEDNFMQTFDNKQLQWPFHKHIPKARIVSRSVNVVLSKHLNTSPKRVLHSQLKLQQTQLNVLQTQI